MKILMLLDHNFQSDLRVENEIIALTTAGHEVHLLCLNYGEHPNSETRFGAQIHRVDIPLKIKKKLAGLNNSLFNLYPYWWKNQILSYAEGKGFNALHVHDLWMMEAAIRANNKLNIKLVADLHENYVYALTQYKWSNTFPGKYLVSIDKWKRSEKEWLSHADSIIVVIEEAKVRLQNLINDKSTPIEVVANYVNLDEFEISSQSSVETLRRRFNGKKVLCYTGGFDKHRGLENLLDAIAIVKDAIPELLVVLVGAGSNLDDLILKAKDLGIEEYISFEGWQDSKLLPDYISAANVCIVPHLKSKHTDNTIPHKLFQYMLFEKPVLVSNCDPLIRIVEETQSGLVFDCNSAESLSKSIVSIFSDSTKMKEYGSAGRAAVLNKYNWTSTSQSLLDLYERFEG